MPTAVLDRVFTTQEETVSSRDELARREEARARAFNGQIQQNYAKLLYGEPTQTATPVSSAAPTVAPTAPAEENRASRRLSQYVAYSTPTTTRKLFENLSYKDGNIYDVTATAPVKETAAVAEQVAYAPAKMEEENEDSRPTSKTMETLHRQVEQKAAVSIVSEISAKAKMVLAAIALFVLVAIAVICINTSVLNSLSSEYAGLQQTSSELSARYEGLRAEVETATSDEQIALYAQQNGMTK